MAAVAEDGMALQHADASLCDDPGVVLKAVAQNGLALYWADESLQRDKAVVLLAVKQNREAFRFADHELKDFYSSTCFPLERFGALFNDGVAHSG
mmetsp:Transcript_10628/g.31967  ORF Transcript_10628/g.31967 Transcript_10628/m.31967 type:complete len:95 (+) Transcript_10628:260-544(+)